MFRREDSVEALSLVEAPLKTDYFTFASTQNSGAFTEGTKSAN